MTKIMKVSIIVPVYNVEPYIEGCLKSVGKQQFEGEIECIVVDDCGTDKSIDIARRYVEDYNGSVKFKIVAHEYNRGLSAARNTGVENSSGDYIYFLDSDDELYLGAISLLFNLLKDNPSSDIIIGQFYCPSDPTRYNFPYCAKNTCIKGEGCGSFLFFSDYIPTNATNKLIRMSLAKKYPFKEGLIHEDELWMYQICQEVTCLSFVHTPTYKRVVNSNSIMETSTINRSGYNWAYIFKYVLSNPPALFRELAILKYMIIFLRFYPQITENKELYREIYHSFYKELDAFKFKRIQTMLKYVLFYPSKLSRLYFQVILKYINYVRNSMIACYNVR